MIAFLGGRHVVHAAATAAEGLRMAEELLPDLVILDIGLPDGDGLEVCRTLRERGFTAPILFLTSRDQEVDKLVGFSVGGDDYMVKPISLPVLEARIDAALRRARGWIPARAPARISWGEVAVDLSTRIATVKGREVPLSAKETQLLAFLASRRGEVVSRDVLLAEVWHYDPDVSSRTVDTHILNLRRKLRDRELGRPVLLTVRGRGYAFTG